MSDGLLLREPWATEERQQVATHFGVWAFLATETLFFGAIFLFYAHARWAHYPGFAAGAREADVLLGSINTAVLLTSSLTMAIAERATKAGLVALARAMLWATIALGLAFLAVKGLEYKSDLDKHLLPGSDFPIGATGAAQFWAFYWVVTVVHACHLTIGLGIVGRLLAIPRADLARRWTTAEGSALYWHLVDIVWVFLYPLIYLVGR
jgi:cytochrome c oxidase subunit 3